MKRLYEAIKRLFGGAPKSDTKHTNPGCLECKHLGGFYKNRCMSGPHRYNIDTFTGRTPIHNRCTEKNSDLRCHDFERINYINFQKIAKPPAYAFNPLTPVEVKDMLDTDEPVKSNKLISDYYDIYHEYKVIRKALLDSSKRWERIDNIKVIVGSKGQRPGTRTYYSFDEFARDELRMPVDMD